MKHTNSNIGLGKHRKSGKSRSANPQRIAMDVNKINESKKNNRKQKRGKKFKEL